MPGSPLYGMTSRLFLPAQACLSILADVQQIGK